MSSTKDKRCIISLETSNYSRRCFMTGEYCSQQRNVRQQRDRLHEDKKIMAFVVMNFSDMSEVVYKWRICRYVESLSKYFYINNKTKQLCCSEMDNDDIQENNDWEQVREIQIVRADSNPSSNYVVCNRICQQIQMADLVIVDVSRQNPNVFYEFGMAVSLGKMILPICYSESYFKRTLPEGLQEKEDFHDILEQHIGCYPWRKSLFEYYGIHYRESDDEQGQDKTRYIDYKSATSEDNKFSDLQYDRFPYNEKLDEQQEMCGRVIYEKLKKSFENAKRDNNTLVVYTMEKFVNEDQSGKCIVNFYNNITKKMEEEQCFCGERVGVLVQENYILEDDKDTKKKSNLVYGIGEIIWIGLNQATYSAAERKIKTEDVLNLQHIPKPDVDVKYRQKQSDDGEKNIIGCVKEYIRNRGLMVYPNTPLFVNRANNKFYGELLDEKKYPVFNLYYVMLKTLRYTNQIIVDVSHNYEKCLQALFWLGAAHGSDVYAITVLHEETKEKEESENNMEKNARNIFDVAGLWMAILRSNDIEGFYEQLELAQQGVENHSKLVLSDRKHYNDMVLERFEGHEKTAFLADVKTLHQEKKNRESQAMESYYRNRFWTNMLRYNQLHIYLPQENGVKDPKEPNEPKAYMVRWDFDAVSELSNYLSKRQPIGEYRIIAIEDTSEEINLEGDEHKKRNFISVGEGAKPLGEYITCYINKKDGIQYSENDIYMKTSFSPKACSKGEECRTYKGFQGIRKMQCGILSQHFGMKCIRCESKGEGERGVITQIDELEKCKCSLELGVAHTEIAQVVLWREDSHNSDSFFNVSIVGSSGPATLATTLIFVDEEQKQRYLKDRNNEIGKEEYLVELQEIARKQFMDRLINSVHENVRALLMETDWSEEEISEIEIYCYLLKCAITAYLSTVLYRYFLPLLSERDIKRIHNGMFAFMDHMKNVGASPFALNYKDPVTGKDSIISNAHVEDIIQIVSDKLLRELKAFKGLEVFYTVMVENGKQGEKTKDNRSIQKVQLYQEEGNKRINCIFEYE